MKLKTTFFALLAATGLVVSVNGQTTIATLDFESSGGYSTSITEFSDGSGDYFTRTDGSGIGSVDYSNSGSWFAAEDIDGEGATLPVTLTWNVNITNYDNLEFDFDVAEDDDGSNEDWDSSDYVHVLYSIDGGSNQNLIWFENDGSTFNTAPQLDTDFDGDGDSTTVTNTFSNFSNTIAGTGSSIDIIVEYQLDGGDEDLAIDNLRLQGTAIPEPSTYGAIGGILALALVLYRRRKQAAAQES